MRSKNTVLFSSILMALFVGAMALNSCSNENAKKEASIPDQVSYNFHIRPILSDNCFACHGPDANKREAGLRMDIADSAYKALQENPSAKALVPGKPELSEAFLRISSQEADYMMPPPESNHKLSRFEIKLVEKWIKQGAEYEPHWAFNPPAEQKLPSVKNKEWAKNEIDLFILNRLERLVSVHMS